MVKKIVLVLLIAAVAAGSVFAVEMSAGLGGTFRGNFQTFSLTQDGKDALKASGFDEDIYNTNRIGAGFFAFFDATYVMVSLGYGSVDISSANTDLKKAQDDLKLKNTFSTFDIGILGKYPIDLGGFTLFPAVGLSFRIPLDFVRSVDGDTESWSDRTDDDITEWMSETWIKFGVGADFSLGEKLYLRPMFLYGIGTLNKGTQEVQDEMKDYFTIINHGFDFSLAIGFKF